MRLGIDARPLQGETQYRGIGKSLEYLLEAMLTKYNQSHDFIFYIDGGLPLPQILDHPGYKKIVVPTLKIGRKKYFRSVLPSYRAAKPRKKDVDVFLQYDAALGVPTTVPTVTVFHDLIPLLFRKYERQRTAEGMRKIKNALAGNLYWRKYLRTFAQYKKSKRIIAISESSKQDYIKYIGHINADTINVVHHGVSGFDSSNPKPTRYIKRISNEPYLLYVGGIDLRKNIAALVKTFYELKPNFGQLKLVVVGKEFGLHDQLSDVGWHQAVNQNKSYSKDIINPGFVSTSDLAYLYQNAEAFVFPSKYEGFGLPVLEAFQAGCPVVAYNNSSIPEVAGDAALLVEDGKSMVPAITRILEDKALRIKLIEKGKKQAEKFTWERTAEETIAVLKSALG